MNRLICYALTWEVLEQESKGRKGKGEKHRLEAMIYSSREQTSLRAL